MSVKHALLALLSSGPSTTYQLRKDFESSTGQTWPLNIGQVSTTLDRLDRDGLVVRAEGLDHDGEGRAPWLLTDAGRAALDCWWDEPVSRSQPGRDELVIKLALAVGVTGVDVPGLVQRQRSATLRSLHDVTRLRRDVAEEDLAAQLVLEHHIFSTESELRWLDAIEGSIARAAHRGRTGTGGGRRVPEAGTRSAQTAPASGPGPADGRSSR